MRAAFFTALSGAVLSFWLTLVLVLISAMKGDDRYATAAFIVALMMLAFAALAVYAGTWGGDDDGPAIA